MELAAKIDSYGKGAWIALMVLAFVVFWPLGLALLAYMMWSGRLGCGVPGPAGRWYNQRSGRRHWTRRSSTSGNSAFDEYREETLRRLEEEQEAFEAFLERLRKAKDRAEFDQFMQDRDERPTDSPEAEDGDRDNAHPNDGPESPAPKA